MRIFCAIFFYFFDSLYMFVELCISCGNARAFHCIAQIERTIQSKRKNNFMQLNNFPTLFHRIQTLFRLLCSYFWHRLTTECGWMESDKKCIEKERKHASIYLSMYQFNRIFDVHLLEHEKFSQKLLMNIQTQFSNQSSSAREMQEKTELMNNLSNKQYSNSNKITTIESV